MGRYDTPSSLQCTGSLGGAKVVEAMKTNSAAVVEVSGVDETFSVVVWLLLTSTGAADLEVVAVKVGIGDVVTASAWIFNLDDVVKVGAIEVSIVAVVWVCLVVDDSSVLSLGIEVIGVVVVVSRTSISANVG